MTDRVLLVLVPGAYFQPGDFAAHGFHDDRIDTIVAHLPAEHYLDGDVAPWLHAEIIAPARAAGRRRIWLLGISLGGMGAMLATQADPGAIEGLILLAPFLGTRGLIAEVAAAGGLAAWTPGPIPPRDVERRMLAALKENPPQHLYLGYGAGDRYASAARMLAAHVPESHVTIRDGGHDWPTWERLWSDILQAAPFGPACHGTESPCAD